MHNSVDEKPAYRLYDKNGKEIRYGAMLDALARHEVVLFGEIHNNPIVHWLEYEVIKDIYTLLTDRIILGAEMFETDAQLILNEYLAGTIRHEHFVKEAKAWDNYGTDYRPIVEFAGAHRIPRIATNIPRRYASFVAHQGLGAIETLSDDAQKWIAPLPIELKLRSPTCRDLLDLSTVHGIEAEKFLAAQAIKDATMAHFILVSLRPGRLLIHLNGEYHSRRYGGIYWYLKLARPELSVVTITSVEGQKLDFLYDYAGVADYTIVIPRTMTKTG